jgi:hypothetical protein
MKDFLEEWDYAQGSTRLKLMEQANKIERERNK